MNRIVPVVLAAAALALGAPSTADDRRVDERDPFYEVFTELNALERDIRRIDDYRTRRDLTERIVALERALSEAHHEAFRDGRGRGDRDGDRYRDGRGHDDRYRDGDRHRDGRDGHRHGDGDRHRDGDHRDGRDDPSKYLSFADAQRVVAAESMDGQRLAAITQVARSGRFTTEEAMSLAGMLTMDGAKADALIALYPAVTDPGRYVLALEILTFDSSKDKVRAALND